MVVVLIAWIALALLLGALIGKAIRRADAVQFPDREHAWWVVTPVPAEEPDAGAPSAAADAPGVLAA